MGGDAQAAGAEVRPKAPKCIKFNFSEHFYRANFLKLIK